MILHKLSFNMSFYKTSL